MAHRGHRTVIHAVSCLVLLIGTSEIVAAQSRERSSAGQPSSSRDTRVQHDSLAVHFLRSPKVKPAVRAADERQTAPLSKRRGSAAARTSPVPVDTPLPTKRVIPKR